VPTAQYPRTAGTPRKQRICGAQLAIHGPGTRLPRRMSRVCDDCAAVRAPTSVKLRPATVAPVVCFRTMQAQRHWKATISGLPVQHAARTTTHHSRLA
jgi:hypothetical protein